MITIKTIVRIRAKLNRVVATYVKEQEAKITALQSAKVGADKSISQAQYDIVTAKALHSDD